MEVLVGGTESGERNRTYQYLRSYDFTRLRGLGRTHLFLRLIRSSRCITRKVSWLIKVYSCLCAMSKGESTRRNELLVSFEKDIVKGHAFDGPVRESEWTDLRATSLFLFAEGCDELGYQLGKAGFREVNPASECRADKKSYDFTRYPESRARRIRKGIDLRIRS